ncbi:hypothetical protein AMECASPLE_028945, partial [Ameca splendens]
LCENSGLLWTVLLDKHSGSPDSQAQWYDSPVYLCSVIKYFSGPEEPANHCFRWNSTLYL